MSRTRRRATRVHKRLNMLARRVRRSRRRIVGPINVAWYNLGDGPWAKKAKDLDELAEEGADLVGLAECSDRVSGLVQWARSRGWLVYLGDGSPGAAATPVLARKGLPISRWWTDQAVPASDVGAPGAGPEHMKRKVTNGCRIRRRNTIGLPRRPLDLYTAHLLPSATRVKLSNAARRRGLFREHIRALLHSMRFRPRGFKLLVGDFNAEPESDLLTDLWRAGFRPIPTDPTHGRRQIDLAWTKNPRRVTRARVIPLSSDHDALLVTIR